MPPRFAYWTIIVDGKPTAFRAQLREELEPTFKQLHNKHPDAVMMWFARGRLWASPEEARAAERRGGSDRRDRGWRPGGEHKDPRARFDVPRDEKRRRFAAKLRRESGRPFERPPGDESRGEAARDRPPRPEWQRDRERPRGRPDGKRDHSQRGPASFRPDQERGQRPPRRDGARPQQRPEWKRDRRDERGPSDRSAWNRGPRPPQEGESRDRPWRPSKPGWKPKPPGDRGPRGDRDSRRPPGGGGQRPPGKGPGGFRPKGEGGFAPKGKGGFKPKGPGGFAGRPDNRNRGGGARGPGGRPPGNRGPRGGGNRGGGGGGGQR